MEKQPKASEHREIESITHEAVLAEIHARYPSMNDFFTAIKEHSEKGRTIGGIMEEWREETGNKTPHNAMERVVSILAQKRRNFLGDKITDSNGKYSYSQLNEMGRAQNQITPHDVAQVFDSGVNFTALVAEIYYGGATFVDESTGTMKSDPRRPGNRNFKV